MTSSTKHRPGSVRVAPQTYSSSPSRHTPRWIPGRSTAGASRASDPGRSLSLRSKYSGPRTRSGGTNASEIAGA